VNQQRGEQNLYSKAIITIDIVLVKGVSNCNQNRKTLIEVTLGEGRSYSMYFCFLRRFDLGLSIKDPLV